MALGAGVISAGVQGLAGIAGGIIGGGKRRREQRAAQQEMARAKARMMNLDTSNLAANMENPYEDLTVNTQAADFAAQQNQASLANTMSGLQGAAGGSGIAALAQAMSQQQSQNANTAAADMRSQEQQIQSNTLNEQAKLNQQEIAGAYAQREAEMGKNETMMNFAGQDLAKAQASKAANDKMMIKGATGMASAGLKAFGGFG